MTNTIQKKISTIRLLALDVDGVMTDGGLYVDHEGNEFRRFNVHDGYGIYCLQQSGVEVAIISMAVTDAVSHRAKRMNITECHLRVEDKLATLLEICQRKGFALSEVAYMGDDIPDIPVLQAVGFPIAPINAVADVKENVMYITHSAGGDGAVREICDLFVNARKDSLS